MTLLLVLILACLGVVFSFNSAVGRRVTMSHRPRQLTMEYIPDGLTKKQWAEMKKKEKEESKDKDYGAVGITKFKSRSFEAWQKSGGKNLFPVDPSVPLEERPYMQRSGGRADGEDLKKKGLFGRGQAKAEKRLDVDDKYDELEKKGALKSTTFEMPWSNAATKKLAKERAEAAAAANAANKPKEAPAKKGMFGKKKAPSPYGAAAKAARRKAAEEVAEPEPAPKKKLFGLF